MWVLIRYNVNPPGGFMYEQTEGIQHKFEAMSDINDLAQVVCEFRKGNGLAGATLEECFTDVDTYQCERLGRNPRFCRNSEKINYVPALPKRSQGCGDCGASIK